jgi:hypothetical protein
MYNNISNTDFAVIYVCNIDLHTTHPHTHTHTHTHTYIYIYIYIYISNHSWMKDEKMHMYATMREVIEHSFNHAV